MVKIKDNNIKYFGQEERIKVNPFYESLIDLDFHRNHETGKYSFGKGQELKLDKTFGLDNSVYYGLPDEKTIKLMSGTTIILGIMGYEISDFTASTLGILASFKNNQGKKKTILFSHLDGDNGHVFKVLQDCFDEQASKFDDDQRARIGYTLSETYNENEIFDKSIEMASLTYDKIFDNLQNAYQKFIQVDDQNCEDNDIVLENIIMETMGYDREKAKEINKPLFDKLIEEYHIYNGKEDENGNTVKDRTILNKSLKSKMDNFSNFEYAFANANACSTDYFGAQVRYAFDEAIKLGGDMYKSNLEIESAIQKISANMETPENFYTQTLVARDEFGRWLNENYGIYRVNGRLYEEMPQNGE